MDLPLTAPAYSSNIPGIGGDDLINMYVEVAGAGALAPRVLVGTPALRVFSLQNGTAACRGIYRASNGRVFAAMGSQFCELLASGGRTFPGTLQSSSGVVGMSDNGNEVVIVDGTTGYTFDMTTLEFAEIADSEFPKGCTQIKFIDGYFLVSQPGTIFVRWSELMDGKTWPTLNRASAFASPDEVAAIEACGRELWAFGPYSTQVFYDSGDADQPWVPVQSVAIDIGTDAPHSVAMARDSVIFLGSGKDGHGRVFRTNGYSVAPISTRGIEGILATATDLSGALAQVHSYEGHTFYVLTVASIEKTVVYDCYLGEWHERAWMDPDTGALKRWRGTFSAFGFGRQLIADSNSDAVYELSGTHFRDQKPDLSGEWTLKRRRTIPVVQSSGKMVQHADFELIGRMGEGAVIGTFQDPVVILSWSNDGGRVFSGVQHVKLGKLGTYGQRARIPMLGQARYRVYRLEQTDPVPCAWAGATSTVRVLNS